MVEYAWNDRPAANMVDRIAECSQILAEWAEKTFGEIRKKIKKTEKKLSKAQQWVPDANMIKTCKDMSMELDNLHRLEESYWYMRARAKELKDGDKNTEYFHTKHHPGESKI